MEFANFALYGFVILFLTYLYYLKKNLKKNSLIILGSLLLAVGYFFAAFEKYEYLNSKHSETKKSVENETKGKSHANTIEKSHLILGLFLLLGLFLPVNKHSSKTDIFGIVGHFILINSNFGYKDIAYICLTIFYSLYTIHASSKNEMLDKIQAVGGGLVLLYYFKKLIDNNYKKKEKNL
jgi:hypothetical protein